MALKDWAYGLLRKSERFTKTDMVYLAKGGFWLSLKQVFSIVFSFIMAVAFANFLTQDAYGQYKYILSVIGIIAGLSLNGLKTSIVRSVAMGAEGTFIQGVKVGLKWSIVPITISFVGGAYYLFKGNNVLGLSLLIAGSLAPIVDCYSFYESYLNGKKYFRLNFLFFLIRTTVISVTLIGLMFYTNNPAILSIFFFTSSAFFAITFYNYIKGKIFNQANDSRSLSYGKHLSLMSFFSNFTNRFDSILIFHYLGSASLALYSFAGAIPDVVISFLKQSSLLILPKISAGNKDLIKKSLLRKCLIVFYVMCLIYFLFYFCVDFIFLQFFPKYMEAVPLSKLFGLNFILAGFTFLPSSFIDAQLETRYKYILTTVTTVLKILLMFALVFPFGIVGVIVGEIIARIFSAIMLFYFVYRV